MDDKEMVFKLRKRIFEDWRLKRLTWQEVKEKYGFSKKWFYKWLGRFLKYGEDGLKDKVRNNTNRPHALSWDQKLRIMDYVYEYPTHGPHRIAAEQIPRIGGRAIWRYLKKENLNTRRKRRFWAEDQGKPTLTVKEKLIRSAKKNHIQSHAPGELISMDSFWLNIKDVGKVWQYTPFWATA